MLRRMIQLFCGRPVNRYFRFGARYAAKIPSAFAREIALEQAFDYVQSCQIPGHYAEFGVFRGRTFAAACYLGRERKLAMQYWAFDSFQGLPVTEGEFQSGAYACNEQDFASNVKRCVGSLSDVKIVPGFFSESLVKTNPAIAGLDRVSIAWVDCDLYESTKPVLAFLTPRLQRGSLILFDDWFTLKGDPDAGEQKACREWLEINRHIKLTARSWFGWHGQSFLVHLAG